MGYRREMNNGDLPVTLVETLRFQRQAKSIWADDEREAFIDFISRYPLAGAEIRGTSGARKIRWGRAGMGKRGGTRVVYWYFDANVPLFLFGVYAKAEKADLTAEERNELQKLVRILKAKARS